MASSRRTRQSRQYRRALPCCPHASVLEIGAGDGAVLERLSELQFGEILRAVEISTSAIDRMNRKQIPRLVEARLFNGQQLPYSENTFDLAVLTHVLES